MFGIIHPFIRIEVFPINFLHLQALLSNLKLSAQNIQQLCLITDFPCRYYFNHIVLIIQGDFGCNFKVHNAGGVDRVVQIHARVQRGQCDAAGTEDKRLQLRLTLILFKDTFMQGSIWKIYLKIQVVWIISKWFENIEIYVLFGRVAIYIILFTNYLILLL